MDESRQYQDLSRFRMPKGFRGRSPALVQIWCSRYWAKWVPINPVPPKIVTVPTVFIILQFQMQRITSGLSGQFLWAMRPTLAGLRPAPMKHGNHGLVLAQLFNLHRTPRRLETCFQALAFRMETPDEGADG